MEDLPRYFIVGARPVMAKETEDGGMEVLALDWHSYTLFPNMDYLPRIAFPDGEVDEVTEEEFYAEIERLSMEP